MQYTGEDVETEAEFDITNCVEDGGDDIGVQSDLSKHNLVLKEVITEQGLIRESYFCQDCFVEYSDVNEFLQQHPGVELLESPELDAKQEDIIGTEDIFEETIEEDHEVHIKEEGTQHDKLWELVENIIEEDHTDEPQLSELISLNKTDKQDLDTVTSPIQANSEVVDADSEHYFCYECQQIFSSLKSAEEHDCGAPSQSETVKEQSDEMLEHQNADQFEAEPEELACVYCGQISSTYEDLKKHMIYCEQNVSLGLYFKSLLNSFCLYRPLFR